MEFAVTTLHGVVSNPLTGLCNYVLMHMSDLVAVYPYHLHDSPAILFLLQARMQRSSFPIIALEKSRDLSALWLLEPLQLWQPREKIGN